MILTDIQLQRLYIDARSAHAFTDFEIKARTALATTKATDAIAPTEGARVHALIERYYGEIAKPGEIDWGKRADFASEAIELLEALSAPSPEAPAVDARGLIRAGLTGLANHVRACAAYEKLRGDMDIVDQAIAALSEPAVDALTTAKPIYQLRLATGDWRDQDEGAYRYNAKHCPKDVRIVYAHPASEPKALTDRYVQRYNEYSGEGGGVCENDEGEYVKYSDYIALLADRGSEQS